MKRLQKWLPGLLIFVVLLASLAGGAAYAKYVTDKQLSGSVTIKAELGTITLQEHNVVRNADGSYSLIGVDEDGNCSAEEHTHSSGNSYIIIPGLDIPKDPFVTVDKKSPIPVYVFVEILETLPNEAIDWKIDDTNWIKISASENNGAHGGTVYVYTGGTGSAQPVTGNIGPVYILKNNEVIVGQELRHGTQTGLGLTFYACMGEVAAGKDSNGNISITSVYENAK